MQMEHEHVDILVVGAGLSGIGAGYHIQDKCPDKSYVILEGRASMGGTWDLFKYPGVRSDSDMFTLGYSFNPWVGEKSITSGESILDYIKSTASKFGIDEHIRYQHRVVGASWSSAEGLWTIDVAVGEQKTPKQFTCSFVYMCTGYYDYDQGYLPNWDTLDTFQGEIVHPQKWTDDVDYTDNEVVVIGSGATAVTLVPAMAEKAKHVTMLQRSPTYIVSQPSETAYAKFLFKILPEGIAHTLSRWFAIMFQMFTYQLAQRFPNMVKKNIMEMANDELGGNYDVETHFNPSYNPWDQRLCVVPDSDLFNAMNAGKAAIVTDHVERFTENGILLKSGEELHADMIVTATGLSVKLMHGVDLVVDGEIVDMGQRFNYKGMMYSDIPNLAQSFGYTNASWTLKSELISEYVCRLVNYMSEKGVDKVVPIYKDAANDEGIRDIGLSSGYLERVKYDLPMLGQERPWRMHQNYILDMMDIRFGNLEDGALQFSKATEKKDAALVI